MKRLQASATTGTWIDFGLPRRRARIAGLCLVLALLCVQVGCGAPSKHVYKLYPGPELSDPEVATLVFGDHVHIAQIDGMTVQSSDYGSIKLLPGEHSISFGALFGVSVLVNPAGFDSSETSEYVVLEAGHEYALRSGRTTGYGYEMYLWIEDTVTGEVVAGARTR